MAQWYHALVRRRRRLAIACVVSVLTAFVFVYIAVDTTTVSTVYHQAQSTTSAGVVGMRSADIRPVGRRRRMYVTMPGSSARLGNQMFAHASLVGLAATAGYDPVESTANSRLLQVRLNNYCLFPIADRP
jgi:hypothetical protein